LFTAPQLGEEKAVDQARKEALAERLHEAHP
jgi:hypothetical protein